MRDRQRTRALGDPFVGRLDHCLQIRIAYTRDWRGCTSTYDTGVELAAGTAAFVGKRS